VTSKGEGLPPVDPKACALSLTALSFDSVCPQCERRAVEHRGWRRELERGAVAFPGFPVVEPDPAPPIVGTFDPVTIDGPRVPMGITVTRHDDGDAQPIARAFHCQRCGRVTGFDPVKTSAAAAHCPACDDPPAVKPRQSFPVPVYVAPPSSHARRSAPPSPRPDTQPAPDSKRLGGRLGRGTKKTSTRGMLVDFVRLLADAFKR